MQQTSLSAYHDLCESGKLGDQAQLVLHTLDKIGEGNIRMIADRSRLGISSVCGRLKELREQGLVIESYRDKCPFTGKTTIFWRKA